MTRRPEGRNAPTVSVPSVDEPAAAGSSSARLDYISASAGTVSSPQFHMSPHPPHADFPFSPLAFFFAIFDPKVGEMTALQAKACSRHPPLQ